MGNFPTNSQTNSYRFNPNYALGFVVACPDDYREEAKTQKNQAFSERSIVISMVSELNAAKRLIMSAAADGLVITCAPWRRSSNAYFGFKKLKGHLQKEVAFFIEKPF